MFERRLKLFLFFLCLVCLALILRAGQIQILQHDQLSKNASALLQHSEPIQTTRGSIYDRKGILLAVDSPCIDACVDYRAIGDEPDTDWLNTQIRKRMADRLGDQWQKDSNSEKTRLVTQETPTAKADLNFMWSELARVSGQSTEDIAVMRQQIVARVEMQRRYVWWHSYVNATAKMKQEDSKAWFRSLLTDSASEDDIDKFDIEVGEQVQPHIIVHNLTQEQQAALTVHSDRFFALQLLPGKFRYYPQGRVACNIVGRLSQVGPGDTGASDPFLGDEFRKYFPSDLIGRGGLEELCESTLRGYRGKLVKTSGASDTTVTIPPKPGGDVHSTIDVNVQRYTEDAFEKKRVHVDKEYPDAPPEIREHQQGAAVVLQIATGDVLAMASNPGFDPNTLDTMMAKLQADDLNMPLMDRATEMAEQPGSTIKPVVGCAAISEGVISPTDRIQCTGTLMLDGKPQSFGHCWTYSLWKSHPIVDVPSHNAFPGGDFPNDSLTVADGLERSCNVVFETLADRLKLTQLDDWYTRFGLGRQTGIGIRSILGTRESSGTILQPADATRTLKCLAGIGEARVLCTPIQMANVAATIARNGIWIRPHLTDAPLAPEDRVDLHIPPEALKADHDGMRQVVNAPYATGLDILPDRQEPISPPDDPLRDIVIAGKTGTAQTSALSIHKRDEHGNIIPGNVWEKVPVGTPGTESWYASTEVLDIATQTTTEHFDHAWFIGYAPADHPQVAFAVLVEYGVSGGRVAGAIAHDILVACCKEGYLKK